jgi:hypothetical protein
MLDSCLELSKIKAPKMLDLQTKSAHFAWIELKDLGRIPLSNPPV